MRKLAVCWLLLTSAATLSLAADLNGDWTAEDGKSTFHFEVRGGTITGFWEVPGGGRCEIDRGSFASQAAFGFHVVCENGDRQFSAKFYEGGNEIRLMWPRGGRGDGMNLFRARRR
jgi:hypothetical protein